MSTIASKGVPAAPLELEFTIWRAKEQQPVGSPCTNVCRLHVDTGLCEGCFRSRAEIKAWKTLDDPARLSLLDELLGRKTHAVE